MKRFTVAIMDLYEDKPGLRFMDSKSYANMIYNEPGLGHINFGDLFANSNPSDLASFAYDKVGRDKLEEIAGREVELVDTDDFNPFRARLDKDFVVSDISGLWYYSPRDVLQQDVEPKYIEAAIAIADNISAVSEHGNPGSFKNNTMSLRKDIENLNRFLSKIAGGRNDSN